LKCDRLLKRTATRRISRDPGKRKSQKGKRKVDALEDLLEGKKFFRKGKSMFSSYISPWSAKRGGLRDGVKLGLTGKKLKKELGAFRGGGVLGQLRQCRWRKETGKGPAGLYYLNGSGHSAEFIAKGRAENRGPSWLNQGGANLLENSPVIQASNNFRIRGVKGTAGMRLEKAREVGDRMD